MKKTISLIFVGLALIAGFIFQGSPNQEEGTSNYSEQAREISKPLATQPDFGEIPLYFIPNKGQVNEKALYYSKTSKYTLWLTKKGLVFDAVKRTKRPDLEGFDRRMRNPKEQTNSGFERNVSRLLFLDPNPDPEVISIGLTDHNVNYFRGNDSSKWNSDIRTSKAALYKNLYDNIDLKVYGIEDQIEYDYIVKPGGLVSQIGFEYRDVHHTSIDSGGNLVIMTEFGKLKHAKPVSYQKIDGKRIEVKARFQEIKKNVYGFEVEEYDKDHELVIDPLVLVYSSYLGGSDYDWSWMVTVNSSKELYITGATRSIDFPVQNPISVFNGDTDVFVSKFNAAGNALIFSTFLGGSVGESWGEGITLDSSNSIYVLVGLEASDFPTVNPIMGYQGMWDTAVVKLNSTGSSIIYSTFFGGSDHDMPRGISVDSSGNAHFSVQTFSSDYPVKNACQPTDPGGYAAVGVTKINSTGNNYLYSTYLGGNAWDAPFDLKVDSSGRAIVVGGTYSTNFPLKNAVQASFG